MRRVVEGRMEREMYGSVGCGNVSTLEYTSARAHRRECECQEAMRLGGGKAETHDGNRAGRVE